MRDGGILLNVLSFLIFHFSNLSLHSSFFKALTKVKLPLGSSVFGGSRLKTSPSQCFLLSCVT